MNSLWHPVKKTEKPEPAKEAEIQGFLLLIMVLVISPLFVNQSIWHKQHDVELFFLAKGYSWYWYTILTCCLFSFTCCLAFIPLNPACILVAAFSTSGSVRSISISSSASALWSAFFSLSVWGLVGLSFSVGLVLLALDPAWLLKWVLSKLMRVKSTHCYQNCQRVVSTSLVGQAISESCRAGLYDYVNEIKHIYGYLRVHSKSWQNNKSMVDQIYGCDCALGSTLADSA